MTDIECPQCGHRALSVATRCPRCGHEFPEELLHRRPPPPGRGGRRPALLLAGAVAAVLALTLLLLRGGGAPAPPAAPAAAVTAAPTGAVTAPAADTTPPAASPPVDAPQLRFATTWVNLRDGRGPRETAVRVLNPGDSVMVDSLVGGWYRVLEGGRPLGYAHRRFLAPRHPADRPER
jgi:hypothetical protein